MDTEACNLCLKFIMVPTEVKRALFSEYINACRDLYAIAFLQWRLRFPCERTFNEELIIETIQ